MTDSPAIDAVPWIHRYVDLPELRLHVTEAGPEDGTLVVLLHGFPEFWYAWRYQIGPLARAGYRVVVPDQRGYNLSDKPRGIGAYRLDRLGGDVIALIDAFGRERANVVGHDWGGAVAWWLGANASDRLHRLAVLNLPHPLVFRRHLKNSRSQRRRSRYMFMFQLPWLPERRIARDDWAMGVKALSGSSRPGTFSAEDLALYKTAWSRPDAIRGMLHWYRAAFRRRPPWSASRVDVPTRILWGMKDRFLESEMIEPSLALCSEADAVRIDAATHWVQHEEPERVNRLLLEHFAAARA